MATNEFLPFASAGGANVLTSAEWLALASRSTGWTAGVAKSEELNKAWRQSLAMSAMVGRFIAEIGDLDALDNGDLDALLDNFVATYRAQRPNYIAAVGGTANALTAALDPVPESWAALVSVPLLVKITTTNTGAATLNLNDLGAKAIVYRNGAALLAGELVAGDRVPVSYNGTNVVLMGPARVQTLPINVGANLSDLVYSPTAASDILVNKGIQSTLATFSAPAGFSSASIVGSASVDGDTGGSPTGSGIYLSLFINDGSGWVPRQSASLYKNPAKVTTITRSDLVALDPTKSYSFFCGLLKDSATSSSTPASGTLTGLLSRN